MNGAQIEIAGGDYIGAGKGSKALKEGLRKIGVAPEIIRRAIVAVYEAEMNVVIHARHGMLRAAITPQALEVIIEDSGPGIPDIESAMREGFSTAPPEARELGFGAGMGLPNIRRNTDRFTLHSTVDKGTTLRFSVFLQPETADRVMATALTVEASKCIHCLRCLSACPTQAIRIRSRGPEVMRHLCVDCTSCMECCPEGVFDIDCASEAPSPDEATLLVTHDALLGQFGPASPPASVAATLGELGWKKILLTSEADSALESAINAFLSEKTGPRLALPPVCPAVLNLIRLRYPALIQYVLPFLSPFEMIRDGMLEGRIVYVPSCPAQSALVREVNVLTSSARLHPRALVQQLLPRVRRDESPLPALREEHAPVAMAITGMRRVCQFLDRAERGQTGDCAVVALYACDAGCFGSPVWDTPPAVSMHRAELAGPDSGPARVHALHRLKPLTPRSGARLDADMVSAVRKLAEIDRLAKALPGRDCGVCGAPTCLSLAEDVVMGNAQVASCIFMEHAPADQAGAAKEK